MQKWQCIALKKGLLKRFLWVKWGYRAEHRYCHIIDRLAAGTQWTRPVLWFWYYNMTELWPTTFKEKIVKINVHFVYGNTVQMPKIKLTKGKTYWNTYTLALASRNFSPFQNIWSSFGCLTKVCAITALSLARAQCSDFSLRFFVLRIKICQIIPTILIFTSLRPVETMRSIHLTDKNGIVLTVGFQFN